jgi:hypothetical protein
LFRVQLTTGRCKTFQVNLFQNNAELIEPGIDRTFTLALQDIIMNQTNLNLVKKWRRINLWRRNCRLQNKSNDSDRRSTSFSNRLKIRVNVRFTNKNKSIIEKRLNSFYDYPATQQLSGSTLNSAIKVIYERITQDIFNESLKW